MMNSVVDVPEVAMRSVFLGRGAVGDRVWKDWDADMRWAGTVRWAVLVRRIGCNLLWMDDRQTVCELDMQSP